MKQKNDFGIPFRVDIIWDLNKIEWRGLNSFSGYKIWWNPERICKKNLEVNNKRRRSLLVCFHKKKKLTRVGWTVKNLIKSSRNSLTSGFLDFLSSLRESCLAFVIQWFLDIRRKRRNITFSLCFSVRMWIWAKKTNRVQRIKVFLGDWRDFNNSHATISAPFRKICQQDYCYNYEDY